MGHRHHRLRERWRGARIATVRRCDGWPAGPAPSGMLSRWSRTSERDRLARVRLTLVQYAAQASITLRRFSSTSPRR
jgi:hypothetical protein